MKKIFLSFTLLAFSSIQAFEYNPIQQAIVDRDPDKLVELLATTTLSYAEKKVYLDLAEQVILDNFLPPARQAFQYKMTYKDTFVLTSTIIISLISAMISAGNSELRDGNPMITLSSGVIAFGSFVYLLSYFSDLQSKSSGNAVKIKQILLAA